MESFGHYKLLARVASGGMGEVFKAKLCREGGFEKVLAVKRLLPGLCSKPDFAARFTKEARLSARLNHANIVHIYDFGQLNDSLFLAMEYVAGMDLGRLLAELRDAREALAPRLALHIAAEVCRGLDYAHRLRDEQDQPLKLVHRDVSPSNILLSFESEIKLSDFGLARAQNDGKSEEYLAGKFAYMAPEQISGETIDRRSDLYSLGLVLDEMLRGQAAFGQCGETLDAKRRRPPLPQAEAWPKIEALLAKATAYEKADRFASARDLLLALEEQIALLPPLSPEQELGALVARFAGERERNPAGPALARTIVAPRPVVETPPEVPRPEPIKAKKPYVWVVVLALLGLLAAGGYRLFFAQASVRLESNPPGASISLDGHPWPSLTPSTLDALAPGIPHQIKVTLPHFESQARELTLESGERQTLRFTLVRATRRVLFSSTPSGASVTLDGQKLAPLTPFTSEPLALGQKHRLVLEKEGFVPLQTEFILDSAGHEAVPLAYTLRSFYKELHVQLSPRSALLFLDGKRVPGSSPFILNGLIPGRKVVLLAAQKGYKAEAREVLPDSSEPLSFELAPFSAELELLPSSGLALRVDGKEHGEGALLMTPTPGKPLMVGIKSAEGKLTLRLVLSQSADARGPQLSVSLDAVPWANLWLDREAAQSTPLSGKTLPAGRHRLQFAFGAQGKPYTLLLNLR